MGKQVNPDKWEDFRYAVDENIAWCNYVEFLKNRHSKISATATTYGEVYDVIAVGINWMPTELKTRDHKKVERYALQEGFFIEPKKVRNLRVLHNCWYVNFDGDWRSVYTWRLDTIDWANIKIKKNVKITLKNGDYYYADRYCLPANLAYHYLWDDDNKIYKVTKPYDENRQDNS